MPFLKDLMPTSRIGLKGKRPDDFPLGPNSTLHNTTSVNGIPPFNTYKSAYIRAQRASKLGLKGLPSKYLDNPPK